MNAEKKHVKKIAAPLSPETAAGLRAGDRVLISGVLWGARDAAHERMIALLDQGLALPFDIRGQVIYYLGPTPARPGRPIGAAGPTTAGRMDRHTPRLLELGLKGMIGKGRRSPQVLEAMRRHGAVYFAAVGGAAAVLAKSIREAAVVAWEDLGPEALLRLVVKDFPAVVANDSRGGDLFDSGRKEYRLGGDVR